MQTFSIRTNYQETLITYDGHHNIEAKQEIHVLCLWLSWTRNKELDSYWNEYQIIIMHTFSMCFFAVFCDLDLTTNWLRVFYLFTPNVTALSSVTVRIKRHVELFKQFSCNWFTAVWNTKLPLQNANEWENYLDLLFCLVEIGLFKRITMI